MHRSEKSAWVKMDDLTGRDSLGSTGKDRSQIREDVAEERSGGSAEGSSAQQRDGHVRLEGTMDESETRDITGERRRWRLGRRKSKSYSHTHFRVYKRRWFGLAQLVLLNIVVSWDVSSDELAARRFSPWYCI
jgi:FLVCR family MFS transporter 7